MSNLFQGEYIFLHSGEPTDFKIDCDHLTEEDNQSLAKMISKKIKFSEAVGIPKGGENLATALNKYKSEGPILIVDDVLTTGASFRSFLGTVKKLYPGKDIVGVCIFCRRIENKPEWVQSIFTMWGY